MSKQRPVWCQCHDSYWLRELIDPLCPHEEFGEVEELLDALDTQFDHNEFSPELLDVYERVAGWIRPGVPR